MKKKTNQYKLEQSPLYRLRNRGKLAEMLGLPRNYFRNNYKLNIKYSTFYVITGKNKKQRLIQSPCEDLKLIQKKLLKYLSRVETPDWLISGKRGKSYVDNAKFHINNNYVVTADIMDFYPSCKRYYVYEMFKEIFKMESDIAGIVTDIATYNDGIPTGAPTSQLIAYWSYKNIFINISEISKIYSTDFSLYVDDMTFSCATPISRKMIYEIEKELKKCGLKLKKKKTKIYNSKDFKLITGVVCDKTGELKVPNQLRKEIIEGFNEVKKLTGEKLEQKRCSLLGKIYSARQIESNVFPEMLRSLK